VHVHVFKEQASHLLKTKVTFILTRIINLHKYFTVKHAITQLQAVILFLYKWRRCSKKKCCKQCGQVKFMGTMTKWPVQKHKEHQKTRSKQRRNRHKEITNFVYFDFSDFYFQFSIT